MIRLFNWLTPRMLTERFQRTHLVANYSLLTLALVLYGFGVVGVSMITWACVPGIAIFFLSLQCLTWRMDQNDENPIMLLMNLR